MNINHLTISGNLTRPVELRSVGTDKTVAKFTVAHNSKYKNSAGELVEETAFLDCVCWDRQAETAGKYLIQGSLVAVEGEIRQENWNDKESGAKRSKLTLRVSKLHLMPRGETKTESAPRPERVPAAAPRRPSQHIAPSMDDAPPFMREDFLGI